jgi:prepilin-type N-terminal cleavage/methylation domain-containing protein
LLFYGEDGETGDMERQKLINKNKHDSGFTLAELLIVVVIIGVLVAISIPIFAKQLEKSRRAVDIANARVIRSAMTLALNQGDLEITDDTTEIVLHVSREKTDGGVTGGNFGNVFIGGKTYAEAGSMKGMWEMFSKYGISRDLRMKQKSSDIDWYAVSINGKGECYYYEGKGNMNNYKDASVAKKYDWSELSGS